MLLANWCGEYRAQRPLFSDRQLKDLLERLPGGDKAGVYGTDWPPLCAFSDPALKDLFDNLPGVGALGDKTIRRTLALTRIKPALVRSVIRKGKTLVLSAGR